MLRRMLRYLRVLVTPDAVLDPVAYQRARKGVGDLRERLYGWGGLF